MISIPASRRHRTLALAGALALLSISAGHSAFAETRNATAWERLWKNDDAGAKRTFKSALATNPKDADALRGLGWIACNADDKQGALQLWSRSIALAPGDWTTEGLWHCVTTLDDRSSRHEYAEAAARAILASPKASPSLKESALVIVADADEQRGAGAKGDAERSSLQYIRNWNIAGPFENVSHSGFDKPFAPEQELDFQKSMTGRDGMNLNWRRLALISREGTCEVSVSIGDNLEDILYAVTAIQSASDQEATLSFERSGAAKLFCNGKPVFSSDAYVDSRNIDDPALIPVHLRKGWNTLLVKLADDPSVAANYRLRVLGANGAPLPLGGGASVDPAHASGAVDGAAAEPGALPVALVAAMQPHLDSVEGALLLSDALETMHDYRQAETVVRKAIEAHPDCGALHWQLSQTLSDDSRTDDARAERETARGLNGHLALAELNAVMIDHSEDPATDQIAQTKALRGRFPASSDITWWLAGVYEDAKLSADAFKTAKEEIALSGGSADVLRLVGMYRDADRNTDAAALLKPALAKDPANVALLDKWAEILGQRDDSAPAIAAYRRLITLDPGTAGHDADLAALYTGQGDGARAVETLKTALLKQPQDADLYSQLGDALQEAHQAKPALAAYQQAIMLDPSQVSLRAKMDALSGRKPVIDLAPALPSPSLKNLPADSASVTMLLDEGREVVYPDYATVTRYHQVVRVNDEAGAAAFRSYPLNRTTGSATLTVEQARVTKADGKIENASNDEDGASANFPSLVAGDTIDVTYRVEDYQKGGLAHQFWGEWYFNDFDQHVKTSRFALITPKDMKFQVQAHGSVPQASDRTMGGWRVQEWRASDEAPLKLEKGGGAMNDSAVWLDFSSIPDWASIVRWYQDLSKPRTQPDDAIRTRAAILTKDAHTDSEKIKAIEAYVAKDIQYQSSPFRMSAFVPTEGKQVIREHYGDCKDKAALLTAMLASVGVKSEMVLLSPRNYGVTPYLPSPRFAHAIALVQTPDGPRYIDATADKMGYGDLPYGDQDVPALLIDDKASDLTKIPALPIDDNGMNVVYTGKLASNGDLDGALALTATGNWGWVLRSAFQSVTRDKQDDLLRSVATSLFKTLTYKSGSVEKLDDPNAPLVMRIAYHADHYASVAGNFLLAPLPWGAGGTPQHPDDLMSNGERKQDLEMGLSRGSYHSTVSLELPAGYAVQDLQPLVEQKSDWGNYRANYRVDGNTLYADQLSTVTSYRIAAADVPKLVEYLKTTNSDSSKQFVLKKP
ncbi:hypothetical protein CCAX7_29880 [Capsulimonas corticalis]|uniref:Uncharacterized protein n=1 Tax=Capsulimonas corticalis TaxID=2219043 RepID=A0A402CSW7_9BACT|nr:DUF3857 domain-containing protein [Capsulimonas corticalis]BDI30937.1 hypothetical protein CCAX7_29880 [Capsulimonas corticalis]